MSEKEMELFKMLYENDDPEQAVLVAIKIFSAFLEQGEEDQGLQTGGLQESS